jgi:hypothetical protein
VKPNARRLCGTLQNTQYLRKIERSNSNSQKFTQNLEKLGFLELLQNYRWKHRSCRKSGENSFGRREIGKKWAENLFPTISIEACPNTLVSCSDMRWKYNFLSKPVWTQDLPVRTRAKKLTYCPTRLQAVRTHQRTRFYCMIRLDRIGPSGHTTQKLNSKCFLSVFFFPFILPN